MSAELQEFRMNQRVATRFLSGFGFIWVEYKSQL